MVIWVISGNDVVDVVGWDWYDREFFYRKGGNWF